jgi:hypothetical protein
VLPDGEHIDPQGFYRQEEARDAAFEAYRTAGALEGHIALFRLAPIGVREVVRDVASCTEPSFADGLLHCLKKQYKTRAWFAMAPEQVFGGPAKRLLEQRIEDMLAQWLEEQAVPAPHCIVSSASAFYTPVAPAEAAAIISAAFGDAP